MDSDTITLSKDEMFEVIKAYQILTNFIEKHFKIEDIYTNDFINSMNVLIKNPVERIKVNNFEDFVS